MFLKSLVLIEVQITWFSFFHLIMNFARKSDPMRVLDPAHQKLCSKVLSFMISYKEKPVHGHKKTCSSEKMPDITCRNIGFYWAFFWMNDNSTPQRYDSTSCIAIITIFNGRTCFSKLIQFVTHFITILLFMKRKELISWISCLPPPAFPPVFNHSEISATGEIFWGISS